MLEEPLDDEVSAPSKGIEEPVLHAIEFDGCAHFAVRAEYLLVELLYERAVITC